MECLALRYRPTSFDDLVGQKAVNVVLRAMVAANRVPTALLFKGSRGTGKTTTARILAAALNCEHPPGPCGHCVSCKSVAAGTSLDLMEIDAASNGLVDDIRALRQQVLYGSEGRCRVVVLDEAHSMSNAAFNALLKTLEEPPPGTVFILATTDPGRLPDTVLSRCMPFTFKRISVVDITARLAAVCQAEGITCDTELLGQLAERADGSMRDAIMVLDQITRAGITTVAGYRQLTGDHDDGPALLRTIVAGDAGASYLLLTDILTRTGDIHSVSRALIATLRDLLILHAGADLTCQGDALSDRQALAQRLDRATIFAGLSVLWELRTRACDDPRSGLELAVALLLDKLGPATAPPVPTATSARKLSLDEMARLR